MGYDGDNYDDFIEQQLANRVAQMAVSIDDFEKHRSLNDDLTVFISNMDN